MPLYKSTQQFNRIKINQLGLQIIHSFNKSQTHIFHYSKKNLQYIFPLVTSILPFFLPLFSFINASAS